MTEREEQAWGEFVAWMRSSKGRHIRARGLRRRGDALAGELPGRGSGPPARVAGAQLSSEGGDPLTPKELDRGSVCGNCCHWSPPAGVRGVLGTCHRYPPHPAYGHPLVRAIQFCGEFVSLVTPSELTSEYNRSDGSPPDGSPGVTGETAVGR
jgi:hypothetical protein